MALLVCSEDFADDVTGVVTSCHQPDNWLVAGLLIESRSGILGRTFLHTF